MRGTKQTRRVTAAATTVALLLLSSACSSEPDETPTAPTFAPAPLSADPEPSAPPSPEPSAEPTTAALAAPELPAAATEETPEGAAAFAEWWFETLNYATATGDTERLTEASQLATCLTCDGFVSRIDETYESGGRIEGGQANVEIEPPTEVNDRVATFAVRLSTEGGSSIAEDGSKDALNQESLVLVAATVWNDGNWQMGDLRQ